MQKLLFTTSLLFVFSPAVLAEEGLKSPWEYQVISSSADPSIDQQHAAFELDFSANNMDSQNPVFVIQLSCNGVIQRFAPDANSRKTISVSPGDYVLQLAADQGFNEITTKSIHIDPGFRTVIAFQFHPAEVMYLKPVIYLYPEIEQQVNVQLQPNGKFSFTYPAYPENGWSVTAQPNGQLAVDGKNYPYLFWEGTNTQPMTPVDYSTGFVVNGDEVTTFLEEKLTAMGLNDRERTDFITFWGPRMVQSGKSFVQFLFNEAYDAIATISVSPQPTSIFRVYMLFTPLENTVELNPVPQEIKSVDREGFTLIEWGGSEINYNQTLASHE
ncbi:MAG TPA: hypothetical protein VK151_02405 [Fluviicola sp.]|nr:hypothetical protein [Fluviicola sp.]